MIQRFLEFSVRKNILKNNKSINHKVMVRSMNFGDRIPFLAKYHKKKLIFFALVLLAIHTYDLHKPIIRKIQSMRSPVRIMQSWFIQQRHIPNTILEQNISGIQLSEETINLLLKLYVTADKDLYFGVGRNYLFQVYKDLGVIEGEEETRKFWISSGFYKQRNQKASGVGLAEYLTIFQEALKHRRKKEKVSEQQFLQRFINKFIQKAPEILKWEKQFNRERTTEFLKNMPGDNEKKKDTIIDIIRNSTKDLSKVLTEEEIQKEIKQMGLKGLNLTDKMLYWELRRTWDIVQMACLQKRMSHPLTTEGEKIEILRQKESIESKVRICQQKIVEIEKKYQNLYQESMF